MSTSINDTIVESAYNAAEDLHSIKGDKSYMYNLEMYLADGDLEAVYRYLHEMKVELRAYNEVANNE